MKCNKVRLNLSALLDNELALKLKSKVEGHLDKCVVCRKIFEEIKLVKGIIPRLDKYEASPELKNRILEKLGKHDQPVTVYKRFVNVVSLRPLTSLASAAAVLIIAAAGLFQFFPRTSTADIVEEASSYHRKFVSGQEKMQFVSQSPDEVCNWLEKKINMTVCLPGTKTGFSGAIDRIFNMPFPGGSCRCCKLSNRAAQGNPAGFQNRPEPF